tara:strand:+ start:866 stop:1597 length:732 start_codon:yes stop_codon:yes gene_type:complete
MIQAITKTGFVAYLSTMDNTQYSGDRTLIRYLVKFTNDMDGSVQYSYPIVMQSDASRILDRYTAMTFYTNANPDMFAAQIYFPLAGHYKYEVYEVTWQSGDTVTLDAAHAPTTELDATDAKVDNVGTLVGLVTKGIMYVSEKDGAEQVQYTQKGKSVQSISLVSGGTGYTTVPTIIFRGGNAITDATATCTIDSGAVDSITLTSGGSGYTSNPTVFIVGGTTDDNVARATATIEQTNYIYYGQ